MFCSRFQVHWIDWRKKRAVTHDLRNAAAQSAGAHQVAERLFPRGDCRRIGRCVPTTSATPVPVAQTPRHPSAGRPRPSPTPGRPWRAADGPRLQLHGADGHSRRPALAAISCWPSWTYATRWETARSASPPARACKSTAWRSRIWSRTLRRIHEVGLTTLGACGDAARNVMCCPAPYCCDPVHGQIQWMAGHLAGNLRPRHARLPGNLAGRSPDRSRRQRRPVEPLYGPSYLPRKLKVAIGLPGDNCVDLYAQDVGLLALCENFQVAGYNVLVGGGMGMTPRPENTFPALAQPLAMIRPEQALEVVRRHPHRLPRLRQPRRSPPGAAEVPPGRLGTGEVQGPGRGPLGISPAPRREPTKCGTSTTTWAGTSRATAAGSMACTSLREGSPTASPAAEIGPAGDLPAASSRPSP